MTGIPASLAAVVQHNVIPATSESGGRLKAKKNMEDGLVRLKTKLQKKVVTKHDPNDPIYQRALLQSKQAIKIIVNLFQDELSGSLLRTWLRTFDKNMDMCVTFDEFCEGLCKLKYGGDSNNLFRNLDIDESGEVMLEEVDLPGAKLWMRFRMWCAAHFADAKDMLLKLSNGKDHSVCGKADFVVNLKRFGWEEENEDLLFECIDKDDYGKICLPYLRWFEVDKRKQSRKEDAKRHSLKQSERSLKERQDIANSMQEFTSFLKRKYSTILRAWRYEIDLDGSMTIQRHELFKAVKAMAWPGDVRLLWKGLDKDNSGVTSLQELDMRCAVRLAKFKQFTKNKFGSAVEAFRAFDLKKKGKLPEEEFINACKKAGFLMMTVSLFRGLDWQKNKYVTENDLTFLDSWRCPAYLTCKANQQAAEDFKRSLLRVFKNYIKAWRACLDRDNSNCVAWEEFEAAAKRINFTGDLPGAWRFLDDDASGSISLREIDVDASKVISEFKCWADQEFGSTRRAYKIFDIDNSSELTLREWRKACMAFAYPGDSKALFDALDVDRSGLLTVNEVLFIDSWELSPAQLAEVYPAGKPPEEPAPTPVKRVVKPSPRLLNLALPKVKVLPLESNPVCPDFAGSQDSWSTMSKSTVSPYLPKLFVKLQNLSCVDEFMNNKPLKAIIPEESKNLPVPARIDMLKEKILHQPIMQRPKDAWFGNEEYDRFDLASVRQKTVELRSRTVSILSKVQHHEQQLDGPGVCTQKVKQNQDCDQNVEDMLQDLTIGKKPRLPKR